MVALGFGVKALRAVIQNEDPGKNFGASHHKQIDQRAK